MIELAKKGKEYERKKIQELKLKPIKAETEEEGIQVSLEAMMKGSKYFGHPSLSDGDYWFGIPDLIRRQPGKSKFGKYFYEIVEIKSGLNVKRRDIYQVVFYSLLLGKIQNFFPPYAYLKMGDGREEEIIVSKYSEDLVEALDNITGIVRGTVKCEPTMGSHCRNCGWRDYCLGIAIENGDISLIKGVGPSKKVALGNAGIETLHDVVNLDPEEIKIRGIGKKSIEKFRLQAKALIENRSLVKGNFDFPDSKCELFFDMESSPSLGVEWLFGILVQNGNETKLHQFVAKDPGEEKKAFSEFLQFISKYQGNYIYHYHTYETGALRRLAQRYPNLLASDQLSSLLDSMIDLYKIICDTLVLPLYFYSLKDVAKYLGFSWRDSEVDAVTSILLYDKYIETRDESLLQTALDYNHDDLIATKLTKRWLAKTLKKT